MVDAIKFSGTTDSSVDATDKKLAERIYHKVMVQLVEGQWCPPDAGAEKTKTNACPAHPIQLTPKIYSATV
jgi:hypothetical protein